MLRPLTFAACLAVGLTMSACDGGSSEGEGGRRSLPNSLSSVTGLDFETPSGVFPLYRGQDMNGGDVYYIVTESNEIDESIRLGLNWTPKASRRKAIVRNTFFPRCRPKPFWKCVCNA